MEFQNYNIAPWIVVLEDKIKKNFWFSISISSSSSQNLLKKLVTN